MRFLPSVFLILTLQGIGTYSTPVFGFTPILPRESTVSASIQSLQRTFLADENEIAVDGVGAHLGLTAPLAENLSLSLSAGHLAHAHFYGPMDLEGQYGTQLQLTINAGLEVVQDFFVVGIVDYTQENWHFEHEFLAERPLIVELDTKLATAGFGMRYQFATTSAYGALKYNVFEDNIGSARFTVLGSQFRFERDAHLYVQTGLAVALTPRVSMRLEKYWVGDETWGVAWDLKL